MQLAAGRDRLTWETSTRPTRDHGPSCADLVQLAAGRATWCAVPGSRYLVRALVAARPGTRPADQAPRPAIRAPCSVSEYPLTPGSKKGPRSGGHGL